MNSSDICRTLLSFYVRFSLIISPLHLALAEFKHIPGREDKRFEMIADLNLGALIAMSEMDYDNKKCVNRPEKYRVVHRAQVCQHVYI